MRIRAYVHFFRQQLYLVILICVWYGFLHHSILSKNVYANTTQSGAAVALCSLALFLIAKSHDIFSYLNFV